MFSIITWLVLIPSGCAIHCKFAFLLVKSSDIVLMVSKAPSELEYFSLPLAADLQPDEQVVLAHT